MGFRAQAPLRLCLRQWGQWVAKIAEALEVSLDYLIGSAAAVVKDKKMLYRLELLEKVSEDDKQTILKVLDSLLKDAQHTHTQEKLK